MGGSWRSQSSRPSIGASGQLKSTVFARLEAQAKTVIESERRGVAAHVRQALAEVGVPNEFVRLATTALVKESTFRDSVIWSKIGDVKVRVLEIQQEQGGRITPNLRQELVDSGVPVHQVDSMVQVILQECEEDSSTPFFVPVALAIAISAVVVAGGAAGVA